MKAKTKKRRENVNDNDTMTTDTMTTDSYKHKILSLSRRINLDALYLAFNSEQFPEANKELDKVKTLLETIKAHFEGLFNKKSDESEKTNKCTEPISELNENHNNKATENEDFQFVGDDNDDGVVEGDQTNETELEAEGDSSNLTVSKPSLTSPSTELEVGKPIDEVIVDFTPIMDAEHINIRSLLDKEQLKKAVQKKVVAIPKEMYEKNKGFWSRHIESMLKNDRTNNTTNSGNQLKDFTVIDWQCGIEPTRRGKWSLALQKSRRKVGAGLNSLKAVSREGEFYFGLPPPEQKPVGPEDTKTQETEKLQQQEKSEACVCEKCGHVAKTPAQLARHMGIHDPNHQYRCAECGQEFGRMEAHDLHMLTHPNHPTFMCEVCGKQYQTRSRLRHHTQSVHGDRHRKNYKKTKCHLCDKIFNSMNSMRRHLDTAHMGRRYECDICLKKFSAQYALKFHKNSFHGERLFQCDVCFKGFLQSNSLKNHQLNHNCAKLAADGHTFPDKTGTKPILPMSQRANFSCSVCLRGFVEKPSFCLHMLRHEADDLRQCLVCNQVFTSFKQLKTHIMSTYLKETEKPYKCKECPETFFSGLAYYTHKTLHVNEMAFKCDVCGKMMNSQPALSQHKLSIHSGIKYNCKYCNKEFKYPASIRRHELVHENPDSKPFKCQVCGKDFSQRSTLKTHMWTHSSVKQFHCDTCGEGFNERRRLLIHQKRQHPPTGGSDLRRQ